MLHIADIYIYQEVPVRVKIMVTESPHSTCR